MFVRLLISENCFAANPGSASELSVVQKIAAMKKTMYLYVSTYMVAVHIRECDSCVLSNIRCYSAV